MKPVLLLLLAVPLAAQQPAAVPTGEQRPAEAKAAAAAEQWLTGTVDFGYRAISGIGGDFNTYRSVVNLGEGPKLFGLDATVEDPSRRLFDRLDLRAHNWGGDPYNTARIDARRERIYQFSFDYRNIAYFNFLPSFANPNLQRGLFVNQRSFDTYRRAWDYRLDLLPGRRIVPFAAYSRNSSRGAGITNLVLQANEYTMPNMFRDHSDDIRGGIRFELNRFHLTLEQGGIRFHDDQHVFSAADRNFGNLAIPFLGQRLFLASGNQALDVRGSTIYTRGLFSANPFSWIDLGGQFLFSQPDTDTKFSQNNAGNFFDFATLQFYNAQLDALTSQARRPHTSGNFTAEVRPLGRLRILEAWMTDRLHDASAALLTDQLLAGGNPLDLRRVASAERLELNYNQQQLDVIFDLTSRLSLRGGHRYVWGDARVPAAFVIEQQEVEKGELRRHVALAGASLRLAQKLNVNMDFEASPGDRSYFRTSLDEYRRARIRVRCQVLPSLLVSGNFNILNNQNPTPNVNYDFLSRQNTVAAHWTPAGGKRFSLLAEYTRFTLRSELTYLAPSTLDRELSFYRDNGHAGTALLDLGLPGRGGVQPRISLGGALFASGGSRPARYYQPLGRLALPFGRRVQWYGEWRWYALAQPFYLFEGFRNHQFMTGFRVTM